MEVGERETIIPTRYTVTTRMTSACKDGSEESHFNVSVGSDDKFTDSVHKPQSF